MNRPTKKGLKKLWQTCLRDFVPQMWSLEHTRKTTTFSSLQSMTAKFPNVNHVDISAWLNIFVWLFISICLKVGQGAGGSDHAAAGHPGKDAVHQTEPLPGCQQHPQHTQLRWLQRYRIIHSSDCLAPRVGAFFSMSKTEEDKNTHKWPKIFENE